MHGLFSKQLATVCITLILVVHAALLAYSSKVHSPTWDEVGHLAAGISHWELRRFELYSVNPPLVRTLAAAPVYLFCMPKMDWSYYRSDPSVRSEVYLGRRMMSLNGTDALRCFFVARLTLVPLSLLGAFFCFLWAKAMYGLDAGVAAVLFWSFSPNVLAYGSLITPDLGSSVALIGTCYAFWRWITEPSLSATLILSFAMALAMLTKSVWLGLPVAFGAVLVLKGISGCFSEDNRHGSTIKTGMAFCISVGISLFFVNAFYGFHESFKPLGGFEFFSVRFSGNEPISLPLNDCPDCNPVTRVSVEPANRFRGTWLGRLPVPLPARYVEGIDIQARDFERGQYDTSWQSYMLGQWQQGGWWYYYLLGLVWKVPIPMLLAVLLAIARRFLAKDAVKSNWGYACLLIPATLFLLMVSACTGLNRYFRYCIPVLPVIFIFSAQTVASLNGVSKSFADRILAAAFSACCLLLVAVSVWHSPHHLSYFNEFAGGPSSGHLYLSDTSVDSGQDLLFVRDWIDQRQGDDLPIYLAYFGSFNPADLGIVFRLPPPCPGGNAMGHPVYRRKTLIPGWYVISKNYVAGHSMPVPSAATPLQYHYFGANAYSYFRDLPVQEEIGHSMNVYRITESDVNELMEKRETQGIAEVRSKETRTARQGCSTSE